MGISGFSLHFGWLLIRSLYKEDYLHFFFVSFWLHGYCGQLEGRALVNRFNHTSWVAVLTPPDRPKWVRNRYVIEVLMAFLCSHVAFLEFSVDAGVFGKGLSQISSFFSYTLLMKR